MNNIGKGMKTLVYSIGIPTKQCTGTVVAVYNFSLQILNYPPKWYHVDRNRIRICFIHFRCFNIQSNNNVTTSKDRREMEGVIASSLETTCQPDLCNNKFRHNYWNSARLTILHLHFSQSFDLVVGLTSWIVYSNKRRQPNLSSVRCNSTNQTTSMIA